MKNLNSTSSVGLAHARPISMPKTCLYNFSYKKATGYLQQPVTIGVGTRGAPGACAPHVS